MDDFDEEGNAAELKFGKDFSVEGDKDLKFLMNDEVFVLLERTQNKAANNETFTKTLQYTSRLAASTDTAVLTGVATELRSGLESIEVLYKSTDKRTKLHAFEVAQLANLIPQDCDYEEAVAWIPSLKLYDEDDVQSILLLITRAKSRINTGF